MLVIQSSPDIDFHRRAFSHVYIQVDAVIVTVVAVIIIIFLSQVLQQAVLREYA